MIHCSGLGNVHQDRLEIGLKYKLVRYDKDIQMYFTTKKCRDNYSNFIMYLRGKVEKPQKIKKQKRPEQNTVGVEKSYRDRLLDEIKSL